MSSTSRTSRPATNEGIGYSKRSLQIPPPPLRGQLELAARILHSSNHAVRRTQLPVRMALLQLGMRRVCKQHRLVVAALALLRRKERHRNDEQVLAMPRLPASRSLARASCPKASPSRSSVRTSASAPSRAPDPRTPHVPQPAQTPAAPCGTANTTDPLPETARQSGRPPCRAPRRSARTASSTASARYRYRIRKREGNQLAAAAHHKPCNRSEKTS